MDVTFAGVILFLGFCLCLVAIVAVAYGNSKVAKAAVDVIAKLKPKN